MLEVLTDKLQSVFRRLSSRGIVTEKDLDEALREVRLALLEADVNFRVVREFIAGVREQALGAEVLESLTGPQQVVSVVHKQLVEVLGKSHAAIQPAKQPPTVIMLVGLKGSGKTTTAAKLALNLRKQGYKPLMVSADPHRVAAGEQLQSLGRQLSIPVFGDGASPSKLAKGAFDEARRTGANLLIVDTPGYMQVAGEMLAEVRELHREFAPSEVLLIVDAMTGQEAVNVAQEFHDALGITGFIITKMDGDARGGAALSIRAVTGVPVKFIGTGEKVDALEAFHPDRFASRILGMGDVLSLIEKAQETVDRQQAKSMERKLKAGTLDLNDFLAQIQQVKKMGPLTQVLEMLPGFSGIKKQLGNVQLDDSAWKRAEAIVYSMTPLERHNPEIIDGSRRRRIAQGSGTSVQDINQLLKQWREAKRLMEAIASGRGPKQFGQLR
ncbi:MAG: signal recognition particle protein [Dehalococcoidia bacterium]|nr:signal recognition particle protein [Dehalococcoidia bacterium]